MDATSPYWHDTAGPAQPRPAPATGSAEVEIVGAGVTGLACALGLAQAGIRVRVVDARGIAGGASGRNGGFALRGAALPYDEARQQLGGPVARALWAVTEDALQRLAALAGDAFRHEGSLRLAVTAAERDRIRAEHDALRGDGFAAEWREPAALRAAGGSYHGALYNPPDGAMHPVSWIRRLATAAAEAGAEIAEGVHVATLTDLAAPTVVVATDGLGAGLVPGLAAAIAPARGQMLATAPAPARVVLCPHYARDGYDYWQQLPDGRLLIGGFRDTAVAEEATTVEAVTPGIQQRLEALAATILGAPPTVTHRWSGSWGETPDRLPLVGPIGAAAAGRDGVWIAAGYSGHGNVLGLACGDLLARRIAGGTLTPDERLALAPLDPARFAALGPPARP